MRDRSLANPQSVSPGTPSSEVIGSLVPLAKQLKTKLEWTTNQKVALETAAGLAFAGLRALVTMKNAGLNVAAHTLLSIGCSGVDGGLVIYVADAPSSHLGMAEQDSRFYASLSLLPMFELSNPQEAKDTTVTALVSFVRYGKKVYTPLSLTMRRMFSFL